MTTATENLAARAIEKKDEKPEKRRALGRGLESLLPGPRVVEKPIGVDRTIGVDKTMDPPTSTSEAAVQGSTAESRPFPVQLDAAVRSADTTAAKSPSAAASLDHQFNEVASIHAETIPGNLVVNLDIELIEKNPYQTRYVFDQEALIEMTESIKEHGVVQPVVVRPGEDGRYILVLGERRLRASKMAGKETIPALVRRLSPQQAAEMTVLENVVREDLNPLEQAEAFRVLSKEFHLTQAQIAERIGVSRETVSNYMRLLRLPQKVMGYMLEDRLTFSDARELLRLEKEEDIEIVAEEIVTKKLKWDEIEDRVLRLNGSLPIVPGRTPLEESKEKRSARWVDPNVRAAQMEMERTLGMRVRIRDRNGKGRIVIEYANVDDYERLMEMLSAKK